MFPEYRSRIQQLREANPHFAHMFEQHSELDQSITQLELDPLKHLHEDIEALKRKKLRLKDEMYRLLQEDAQQLPTSS